MTQISQSNKTAVFRVGYGHQISHQIPAQASFPLPHEVVFFNVRGQYLGPQLAGGWDSHSHIGSSLHQPHRDGIAVVVDKEK